MKLNDLVLDFEAPPAPAQKPGFIKAALLEWLGGPGRLTDPAPWHEWADNGSFSGEHVSADKAMQNETVWACAGLIAESVASLPFAVYKRVPVKELAPEHALYPIVHSTPNADMATGTFLEIVMMALLFWGNAFAEIIRRGPVVLSLNWIPPESVTMRRNKRGGWDYSWIVGGDTRTVSEADMLHVVGRTLNGVIGVSPMTYARHVMGGAMSADKVAGKMFSQGLMLGGTFETDQPVKEEKRALFQERLKEYQGAMAAGRAPLLEGGIKFKPVGMNPNDAQMLQTREFGVAQICRWFRVPPHMVGHTTNSTSWGTGLEEQKLGFLTFTLQRWIKRIEDECTRKLLSPVDRMRFFTGFNFEGLLRADSSARAEFYSKMSQNGIYTRNDIRSKESLPPMPGGDVLTVQSNLIPLDMLGKTPPAPTPPATPAPNP